MLSSDSQVIWGRLKGEAECKSLPWPSHNLLKGIRTCLAVSLSRLCLLQGQQSELGFLHFLYNRKVTYHLDCRYHMSQRSFFFSRFLKRLALLCSFEDSPSFLCCREQRENKKERMLKRVKNSSSQKSGSIRLNPLKLLIRNRFILHIIDLWAQMFWGILSKELFLGSRGIGDQKDLEMDH